MQKCYKFSYYANFQTIIFIRRNKKKTAHASRADSLRLL